MWHAAASHSRRRKLTLQLTAQRKTQTQLTARGGSQASAWVGHVEAITPAAVEPARANKFAPPALKHLNKCCSRVWQPCCPSAWRVCVKQDQELNNPSSQLAAATRDSSAASSASLPSCPSFGPKHLIVTSFLPNPRTHFIKTRLCACVKTSASDGQIAPSCVDLRRFRICVDVAVRSRCRSVSESTSFSSSRNLCAPNQFCAQTRCLS